MPRLSKGPRWYDSRRSYYATINGVTHNLGSDHAQARRKFAELTLRAPTISEDATVSDLIGAFVTAKVPTWAPKSAKLFRWVLGLFGEMYGHTKARDLIPYHVTVFLQTRPKWRANSVRTFLAALKGCLQWSVEQGLIRENPILNVKRPPPVFRDDSCLISPEVRQQLRDAASPELKLILDALWYTGQRPGAILTVEAQDVQGDRWVMGEKPGRKRKRITVYLNGPMQVITEQLLAKHPQGALFRNPKGEPWTYDQIHDAFAQTKQAAGLTRVTLYWYRHTYGRRALDAGVDISDLAQLMNTSVQMIERTYGHASTLSNRLRESVKRVSMR